MLQVNYRHVDGLFPYARNARTHSDEQVAQIAASIREFGWTNPILIDDDGGIIAGHGRLLAARKLGMVEVPTITLAGLSETQKRALVIADNKLALNAGWDDELLAVELQALIDEGYEAAITGFSDAEIERLIASAAATASGLVDEDEIPEAPPHPTTVPGDLWVLGRHRLICGDATQADAVARLLGAVRPHLMVTDPPYGVDYDPEWRERAGVNTSTAAKGKVLNDDRADWREAWALFPGDVAYVWHAGLFAGTAGESLIASGFKLRSQIIWDKGQLVLSRGDYHWQHEPCWYAVRGKGHWSGDRKQTTVWAIAKPQKSETGHGTQKPVECMRRPIENNSSPGQAVYEPFSGSGTTIIAGEQSGRSVYAVELNPAYVDIAVERWQAFTGSTATLEGTDRSFAKVKADRSAGTIDARKDAA
ncbi:site-specific DNA-methyltransferase [Prosthecodimorpha staleyi]|uniref:Methyltransferase n=1 Tax=Prosthecodimorpha staleyi TaxID=2840188 RepID=A0A947D696_9HYPH|nr:site-specific DNA-methyltransferase [Prosthecodimorpha staleyi]MBT9291838.1 site-specific DNA-methyltransferase [Prosthecodimorpha staleyi]